VLSAIMATGGSPRSSGRDKKSTSKMTSFSEPRPKKRPVPRFDTTSFDTELSLNTELKRSEDSINHRSLPNNLGWSLGSGSNMPERLTPTGGHKKGKHFEHIVLQDGVSSPPESSQPTEFRRKKRHTPATMPRIKLPSGTPIAERVALERLKQHLTFGDEEIPTRGPSNSTTQDVASSSRSPAANNERPLQLGRGGIAQIAVQESNDTDIALINGGNTESGSEQVDTSQILERLKQVREFLKQATSMFVTMSFSGNEEQRTKEYEQAAKLHKLIKHLKTQEKAYTDLLQRTMIDNLTCLILILKAVEDDLTTENTPSASVQSASDDEKGETSSIREEELQGLRQQHALLQKMLEQQRQLKELQSRQAALLTLQRDAEQRLAEAEGEGGDEGAVGVAGGDTASGRSRSGTEASQLSEATAEGSTDEWRLTPEQLALQTFIRRNKEKFTAREVNEKDRDEGNQRKRKKNQLTSNAEVSAPADLQSLSDGQPDNEEAALAIADAAQERLELENKLMALQAKKEQMDSLLKSIEARKPHVSSINEDKKDNNEEKALATTSQKLDDDSILEALEVHEKLKRLQDVRQHLQQLRDMIGHYQTSPGAEGSTAMVAAEDSAPESGRGDEPEEERGAVGGPPLTGISGTGGQDHNSVDWILNYGIEDPELITKLRQLQAARERVMHLKQTNQTVQLPMGASRFHNETNNQQPSQSQTEDSETEATTTDTESNASHDSSSVNAMAWQDDPEFQEKIKKLKSAKKKLKQLQELVKRVHQFPDSAPVLPTELAELSFDGVDDEDEEDDDDSSENESDYDEDEDDNEEEGDVNQVSESASLQDQEEHSRDIPDATGKATEPDTAANKESKPSIRNIASPSLLRTDTFTVHKPANPRHVSDSSTQTPAFENPIGPSKPNKVYSVDSSEAARAAPTSSALVWSELRRQRELHEEKLKKRKHRLLNEKRKKAGLDDVSEGGTYSMRSADVDEGFGVSMMSADITTATWGGSTQPSSTQNDSAVSEDGSEGVNREEEIAVEVEDDYPDGIVQAEEEEEERDDPDAFPRGAADVFRSRERVPRSYPSGALRQSKKRGRGSKGLTFAWPKIGSDRSPRRSRQQNFTPAEELIEEREREQFILERQAWEQQCGQLHGEVAKLTDMCNNLLRDQQTLVSALIGRNNLSGPQLTPMAAPSVVDSNPFSQYQLKQQDAYQSLHSFFDHQRYLLQHQQLMQTLNQCYAQLHQQQQDLGCLQGQFQQLFSGNSCPSPVGLSSLPRYPSGSSTNPFTGPGNVVPPSFPSLPVYSNPTVSSTYSNPVATASNAFGFSPFQMGGPGEPSGFTPATLNQSDLQWQSGGIQSGGTQATAASQPGPLRAPSWMPVFSDPSRFPSQCTQTDDIANPDTGVPSPRYSGLGSHPTTGTSTPSGGFSAPMTTATGVTNSNLLKSYNPSAYEEPSSAAVSSTRPTQPTEVVGRTFPTPLRAQAVANLANKDRSSRKHAHEFMETSSHTSSVPGEDPTKGYAKTTTQDIDRASDAGSEFSLFEALRDSIYSEVATLISLNESRPHFLIELFRELQLLTSDYLRQRALYALRDIVTRFLTEDTLESGIVDKSLQQARFQVWAGSNSELTPSETVETSEDEGRDEVEAAQVITEGVYDYAENVESGSTLSTPTSSHTGDPPFASDGLGETVIHFDQTLSKMREIERLREQGKLTQLQQFSSGRNSNDSKGAAASNRAMNKDDVTTSSAGDVGSDSSFSDVQYPRIDTQALDHQIKSIMSEVIPYLNEHMEDSCTADLLGYIRGLVLSRIRVRDEQEFGRFFHKQLASILQDSLSKFESQKMKDCGEDMLVDMSEILFNELAFFKLMQDLDGPGARGRQPFWRQVCEQESQSGTDTGTGQEADKEDEDEQPEDRYESNTSFATEETESTMREKAEGDIDDKRNDDIDDSDSSSDESSSEDSDAEDEAAADDEGADEDEVPMTKEQREAEEEALGKVVPWTAIWNLKRYVKPLYGFALFKPNNLLLLFQCVKLELSVSESKPFTSAGSGEEDGEESYDDLQAKRTLEDCEGGTAAGRDSDGSDSDGSDSDGSDAPQDDQAQAAAARPEHLQNGQ
ncbi:hypothetical protein QZH41_013767, partial [Actinostola sp. cb2023]